MANVLRTIIVPAALVSKARELGAALAPTGAGMYVTGLSASGSAPATHYISSGWIQEPPFADILTNAVLLFAAAQQGALDQGLTLTATQTDANNLVAQSTVHDGTDPQGNPETPHELMARLGLKLINTL